MSAPRPHRDATAIEIAIGRSPDACACVGRRRDGGQGLGISVPSDVVSGQWSVSQTSEIRNQKSDVGAAVELPHQPVQLPHQAAAASPEPLIPPIIIDTSTPGPAPLVSTFFAPGGWGFSYAAATVITVMLVLGAWVYKVSLHGEVAMGPPAPLHIDRPPQPVFVGRITGTADCRWADPQDAPIAAVPLGRQYELASGLMEISYDTGAKVILEGPCTYEVE